MLAHPSVTRTWATLRIWGRTLNPEDVTALLSITPSDAHKAGERHGKDRVQVWKDGYWDLTSEEQVESTDLEAHIIWILERVEPVGEQLSEITRRPGVKADIFCFWETESMNSGLELSPSLIGRMAALDLKLGVDIYFAF